MKHVSVDIEIDASVAETWPLLAEFVRWPRWGPTVRGVEADADCVAPGVTGRVQTTIGIWLPFVITQCRPEECWHWNVAGVPATRHAIASMGRSRCRVMFSVAWPLAPYLVVLALGLRRLKKLAEARGRPADRLRRR